MPTIERTERFDAPPGAVWDAIIDAESLAEWFDADVEIDARPGGALRVSGADGLERAGVVERVDAGRRLTFTWTPIDADDLPPSTVEFELSPLGDGTLLHVRETTLDLDWLANAALPPAECRALARA